MKALIALLISIAGCQAYADDTPVFVSCYSDAGEHLQLIFDHAQTQFSYRYAKAASVEEFEAAPSPFGASASHVSVAGVEGQQHIELSAQIVGGDPITPQFPASVKAVFDRDAVSGSLKLTSYSIYHLDRPYNIDTFKAGVCYVQ